MTAKTYCKQIVVMNLKKTFFDLPNDGFVEIRAGKECYELILSSQDGFIKNELDVM